ncbi:MAG: GNAT family N-acetyltransferase [Acetatifactor sp.]|nr:GNAT family N-acetyltransferase [Acetatifactor sp.]MDE5951851.1 GNAT family N-acetyltransferase [Acetatifactor sp.]
MISLREITAANIEECCSLTVSRDQQEYIASNRDSLETARENREVARTFAIYTGENMVGFTMFAFDEEYEDPDDRYWLWRFMIDEKLQGRGYGSLALKEIISYFRENGANTITLSTKESNKTALGLYHKFGFRETGEMNDGEIVLRLVL